MSGSVYQRSDGLWCASLQVNGRRKYVYAKTERRARQKLAELQRELGLTGTLPNPGRRTVNDLLDLWLETAELRPTSLVTYRHLLSRYVRPAIGHVRLSHLRPETLQALYNSLKARDLRRVPSRVHAVLHKACKLAVQWGWLAINPADRVTPPAYRPERRDVWSREQLAAFLEGTSGHWLQPLWIVAITTGLRLSELSGLKWEDVDWARGTISVRRSLHQVSGQWVEGNPKTRAGERTVTLPADGIAALKRQRVQQAAWKLAAGQEWQDGGWVFTNESGGPLSRSTIQHALLDVTRRLGIPELSMHGLRHLHASLLIAGGLPITAVSARLGHANPSITMSVYAHALKAQDTEAAKVIERVLSA